MLIRMPEILKQDNFITFCMPGPPGQHPQGGKLARRAKCYAPTAPRNAARGGRRDLRFNPDAVALQNHPLGHANLHAFI
jgi:hypothetical protein